MTMIDLEPVSGEISQLRKAFGCFPSGVVALSAVVDGVPVGMAASSFTSVSLDPPLVSICVQHTSETWPRLRGLRRVGLSILAEGHEDVCVDLSRKGIDRFANISWDSAAQGGLFVHGSSLWLDCSLHSEVPAGDHAIALFEIHAARTDESVSPLVFHGSKFRQLAAL